jgi:hypothetical protein
MLEDVIQRLNAYNPLAGSQRLLDRRPLTTERFVADVDPLMWSRGIVECQVTGKKTPSSQSASYRRRRSG